MSDSNIINVDFVNKHRVKKAKDSIKAEQLESLRQNLKSDLKECARLLDYSKNPESLEKISQILNNESKKIRSVIYGNRNE